MQIHHILISIAGLYFLINGLLSRDLASALIGIGLAAIAFYVVFTGKVHRKFSRKMSTDVTNYKDPDDQQLMELLSRIKAKFCGRADKTRADSVPSREE